MRLWMVGWLLACGDDGPVKPADDTATSGETPTDDSDEPVDTDDGGSPLAGMCPLDSHVGRFSVDSDQAMTVAGGAVTDGVVPVTILEEVGSEGDCTLMRRNNPFCDPPCPPDKTCDFDGACIPFPLQVDMGTVTIYGLKAPVVMEASPPGFSYYQLGLPHPAYDPGDAIRLEARGGTAELTLRGFGLHPLEVDAEVWTLAAGTDLTVDWNAPGEEVASTVQLRVNIDQHGLSPVLLRCAFEDTGEGVLPGGLLQQLVDFGVSGYPSATLTRQTADSTQAGAGCVDFLVAWTVRPEVDVEGFTPCREDEDCPKGQTCNTTLEICE